LHALLERINEWGYELGQTLSGQLEAGSAAAIFVVFGAGVLTSFTPCVYPMIPVTVTFIGGAAAGNRRRAISLSFVYVIGLALIYAALGVLTAMAGKTFGSFTRNPWIFLAVGVLITFFGVTMLGILTLRMPGFAARVQSSGAQKGGHVGALLMGLAAGFVAAPCTAPVLGILLSYVAGQGQVIWGGLLLFVFALGLGFLLMLLGIFSGLLSSLPKPGMWMEWVKRGFGVAMLLVAAYFFYQAVTLFLQRGGGS